MSKAKKKIVEVPKTLTKIEASKIVSELVILLLEKNCKFNLYCRNRFFQFNAVSDYQLIKHHFPQFEIQIDERLTPYAELTIKYEN